MSPIILSDSQIELFGVFIDNVVASAALEKDEDELINILYCMVDRLKKKKTVVIRSSK